MLKPQCWPTLDEIAEVTDRVWASPMYERLDLLLRTDDVRRWGSETTVCEFRLETLAPLMKAAAATWEPALEAQRKQADIDARLEAYRRYRPLWEPWTPAPEPEPAPEVLAAKRAVRMTADAEARALEYQREADVMRRRLEELYIFLREQQEQQRQRLQAERIKDWNLL